MLFRKNSKKKEEENGVTPPEFIKEAGSLPLELGVEGGAISMTMDSKMSEMDTKLASMEKKVDRIEAYVSTTRSELDDVIKRTKEYDENIKKLLSIYEVVSDKFNPFTEHFTGIPFVGERSTSIEREEITTLYGMIAELTISILLDLIEALRRMGIDTTPIEEYLPKEVVS